MKIYFEYPENASQARTELISMGFPAGAIRLDIHQGVGNPIQGVKRAIGDKSTEPFHGATLIVEETDWVDTQKVANVARRYDGQTR